MSVQIAIHFNDKELNKRTRALTWNASAALGKLRYIRYRKINVSLIDYEYELTFRGKDTPICNIGKGIDCQPLYALSQLELFDVVAAYTIELLSVIWKEHNWPVEDLQPAFDKLKQAGYVHTWVGRGKTHYPPTKAVATMEMIVSPDRVNLFLKVRRGRKLLHDLLVLEGKLEIFYLQWRYFARKAWRDEHTFVIGDDLGEIAFVCDLVQQTVQMEYTPKENTLEMVEGYAKALQRSTSDEESDFLFSQ